MRRSKRLLENGDKYEREIIVHNNGVMEYNSMSKVKSFMVVAQDVDRYPTPSSVIAVTSSDKTRYWDAPPKPRTSNTQQPMMFEIGDDGEMKPMGGSKKTEERFFSKQVATQEVGLKEPRYFMIVDEVTPKGDIICYDDLDNKHVFKDNVQVVDLFLYPAMKISHTFQTIYDYNEDIMAIKLGDLASEDEIVSFVDNIHGKKMVHDRVVLTLTSQQRIHMSDIFTDRGILPDNISRTVRIRLENCISLDSDLSTGVYDGAKSAIEKFLSWGYNVDIISEKNGVKGKAKAFLEHYDIPFTTVNGYSPYQIVIEPKSCFMDGIDWDEILDAVYEKAHNKSFKSNDSEHEETFEDFSKTVSDTVTEMVDVIGEVESNDNDDNDDDDDDDDDDDEINELLEGDEGVILELDDDDDDDDFEKEHYLFLLYVEQFDYEEIRNGDSFKSVFPLAPEWDVVEKLQDYFNSKLLKFDDMPLDLQKVVVDLQLEEYFKK
ncbi:hypothetical protein BPT24_083 [Tenacibaculum phage pT24]|uniref:Uncharacterized protein n=1 Tax=Tenacibaculum phage pT24 TaxID=1880590 RepID=A0A1B4XWM0_9CAUD|nr:hypothetical protein HYP10_gp083 [Tenacibaculum phage pT24]BAV39208.1 hypothetical protein BPT24_083 [Tenacibaculum phage pT24]